jgi:hypothetical protein
MGGLRNGTVCCEVLGCEVLTTAGGAGGTTLRGGILLGAARGGAGGAGGHGGAGGAGNPLRGLAFDSGGARGGAGSPRVCGTGNRVCGLAFDRRGAGGGAGSPRIWCGKGGFNGGLG